MVRDFSTAISKTDRTTREKISKNMEELNSSINKKNLILIYRTFHKIYRTTAECTFFSSADRTDRSILACKNTSPNLKEIIIWSKFFNHSGIKLEINIRKTEKPPTVGNFKIHLKKTCKSKKKSQEK